MSSSTQSEYVLINPFHIDMKDEKEFEEGWMDCAHFLKNCDGYIKTSLHKALNTSTAQYQYINYALWKSPGQFQQAIKQMREAGITKRLDTIQHECFPSLYTIHISM